MVRVLLFHPWRFDPTFCGASRTAAAHLDYFASRGWEIHCLIQEIPAWSVTSEGSWELSRFSCVKSIRAVSIDCPVRKSYTPGTEFCDLLYASERSARSAAFRAIAAEPWDAFFTTEVTVAPFAHALPKRVWKILAAGDSHTRCAAAMALPTPATPDAEECLAFARMEVELFQLFDRVQFMCEADADRARGYGVKASRHVPPLVEAPQPTELSDAHDLVVCGGSRVGELADLEWFYRHVYVPHIRPHGIQLEVAGPIAERWPICDRLVSKIPSDTPPRGRIVVAPVYSAPGPHVLVADALAAGRAVVTTPAGTRGLAVPEDAAVVAEMRDDPGNVGSTIRNLIALPGWRRLLGARARQIAERHTKEQFFSALDSVWDGPGVWLNRRDLARGA